MVIWIVGLSGVGKTTIVRSIFDLWKQHQNKIMIIDGDEVRSIFQADNQTTDYDLSSRRLNALRIANLCKWVENQDKWAICAIQCLFDDIMLQNKERYRHYFQVELRASSHTLKYRDTKGLYEAYERQEIKNVVGIDIPYSRPTSSDKVYFTDGQLRATEIASDIINSIENLTNEISLY